MELTTAALAAKLCGVEADDELLRRFVRGGGAGVEKPGCKAV